MQQYAGPELPPIREIKDSFPNYRLPVDIFEGRLDPHQHIAIACGHAVRRLVNMDKVGLGKTIESLGLIEYQRKLGIKPRWILVLEATHLYQWAAEIKEWLGLDAVLVKGTKAKRRKIYKRAANSDSFVLLVSYGSMRNDAEEIDAIGNLNYVFDEAALLANENQTSRLARELCKTANYVLALSAEPMTRGDPRQLWRICDVIGVKTMSLQAFTDRFCIMRTRFIWVPGRRGKKFKKELTDCVGLQREHVHELKSLIYNNSLRRSDAVLRYSGVGGLDGSPDDGEPYFKFNRQLRSCSMTALQRSRLKDLADGVLHQLGEMTRVERLNIADRVTQILVAPWVQDPSAEKTSPKLKAVTNLLKYELPPNERAVMFCRHHRSCELAQEHLKDEGITSSIYTGEVEQADRHRLIENFQKLDGPRVFIMSAAGHRGVNGLQKVTNHLILLDVVFSPAFIVQLIGRLGRRGQLRRIINIFFMVCEKSPEEKVFEKLFLRQSIADLIYDEGKSHLFESTEPEGILLGALRAL